jgi:hypothetical protein
MIDFFPSLFLSESSKSVLNGTCSDIRNPWVVSPHWVTGTGLAEKQTVEDRSAVVEEFIRTSSAGFSLSVSYLVPFPPLISHFVKVYSQL